MSDRAPLFLILIDGLNHRVFSELLAAGRLPHIQRALLEEKPGVWGPVLTTFPSATAPSMPEMLSGKYCHRLGRSPRKIHAFNRASAEVLRYEFLVDAWVNEKNDLFDLVDRYRGPVISLFKANFEKAANIYNDLLYGLDAITDFGSMDLLNYDKITIGELQPLLEQDPLKYALVLLYLAVPDLNGHFHGVHEPRYARSLEETDRLLAALFEKLRALPGPGDRSVFEASHFVLFGDHGMTSTGTHIDLLALFKSVNIPALDLTRTTGLLRNKLSSQWASDIDVLIVPGGSSIAEIYVRAWGEDGPGSWVDPVPGRLIRAYPSRLARRHRYDLSRLLGAVCGIDLLFHEEAPGVVRVLGPGAPAARIYERRRDPTRSWCYQVAPPLPGALRHAPRG